MRRSIRVCTATALLLIASVHYAQSMPVGYMPRYMDDDVFAASVPTVAPNSSRQRQFALYSLLLAMFGDALGYPPQMIAPPTLAAAITHPAYPTGYLTGYPGADYPAYGQQASQYVPGSYGPVYSQIGAPFGGMAGNAHQPQAFYGDNWDNDESVVRDHQIDTLVRNSAAGSTTIDPQAALVEGGDDDADSVVDEDEDYYSDDEEDSDGGEYSSDEYDDDSDEEATADDTDADPASSINNDVMAPDAEKESYGDDYSSAMQDMFNENNSDEDANESDIEESTEANAEEDEDDNKVPQLVPFGKGDAGDDNNDSAVGDDSEYPAGYVQVCDEFSCKRVRKPKSPVSA